MWLNKESVFKACQLESSEQFRALAKKLDMADQWAYEDRYWVDIPPELRREATELFGKFALGEVMKRDQVKKAFDNVGLELKEGELDTLIFNSEDSRRRVPQSEDTSAEDITLNEFINLMGWKKQNDNKRAWLVQKCLDLFDKNKDRKLTKDEVKEVISKGYKKEYVDEIMAEIKFEENGCVDYEDFKIHIVEYLQPYHYYY